MDNKLRGKRFGRLVIIDQWGKCKHGESLLVICECDCGEYTIVRRKCLTREETKSCGCLNTEVRGKHNKIIHGMARTSLYHIWSGIKQRCSNKKSTRYKYYGERGITICAEWSKFPPFSEWAAANNWESGLEIDRRDNNGPYSPANCRIVTSQVNSLNRSSSREWIINGKSFPSAPDAARYFSVSTGTIHNWCLGRSDRGRQPKNNCAAPLLYEGK